MEKVYVIIKLDVVNGSESIVSVYSQKKKETAKTVVDEMNASCEFDDTVEYTLRSYEVDGDTEWEDGCD